MRMIEPVDVTDSKITACSLLEDDQPQWDMGTSYAVGDRVIREHIIYEAASAHAGVDPVGDLTGKWIPLGATNKFRAFDGKLSDPVITTNPLSYTFRMGQIVNAISVHKITAASMTISAVSAVDGLVLSRAIPLVDTENVFDLYSYFTAPIRTVSEVVIDDIPPYGDLDITLTLDGTSISVGQIVIGTSEVFGTAKFGTSVSFKDYSSKDRDVFGNANIIERDFADVVDFDFVVPTTRVRDLRRRIATRRAKPTVFYSTTETLSYGTLVYGFPGQLHVTLSGPVESDVTLDVEGLT